MSKNYDQIIERVSDEYPDAKRHVVQNRYTRGADKAAAAGKILFRPLENFSRHYSPRYTEQALHRANVDVIEEELVDYYEGVEWIGHYLAVPLDNPEAMADAIEFSQALEDYPVLCEELWTEYETQAIEEALNDWLLDDVLRSGGIELEALRDYIADHISEINIPGNSWHNTVASRIGEKCREYGELYVSDSDAREIVLDVLDVLFEPFGGPVDAMRDALEIADLPQEIAGGVCDADRRNIESVLLWKLDVIDDNDVVHIMRGDVADALDIRADDVKRISHAPSFRTQVLDAYNAS